MGVSEEYYCLIIERVDVEDRKGTDSFGVGIPTIVFIEETEKYLAALDKDQLLIKLEQLGLSEEADNYRAGKINEIEVRELLFMAYDTMRSINLRRVKHKCKLSKKSRG